MCLFKFDIIEAETAAETDQVAALLRDYKLWLSRRYVKETMIFDEHFDDNEWQSELADLKGHYGAPFGAILLARANGVAAGCVMLRGIADDVGEVKRLFVRPAYHGLGVGRALLTKLACVAMQRGYKTLRLETGPRQTEAQALYNSAGFRRIAPYHAVAGWFLDNMQFFEAPAQVVAAANTAQAPLTIAA
jgi:ribosomal protein S18 acetylase RimI-like enzyme